MIPAASLSRGTLRSYAVMPLCNSHPAFGFIEAPESDCIRTFELGCGSLREARVRMQIVIRRISDTLVDRFQRHLRVFVFAIDTRMKASPLHTFSERTLKEC